MIGLVCIASNIVRGNMSIAIIAMTVPIGNTTDAPDVTKDWSQCLLSKLVEFLILVWPSIWMVSLRAKPCARFFLLGSSCCTQLRWNIFGTLWTQKSCHILGDNFSNIPGTRTSRRQFSLVDNCVAFLYWYFNGTYNTHLNHWKSIALMLNSPVLRE